MKTLKEISEIVLALPGIESGFLQETRALDYPNVVKVPGGAGEWIRGHKYRTEFRCFLRTSEKHAERSSERLMKAVNDCLDELGIEIPRTRLWP